MSVQTRVCNKGEHNTEMARKFKLLGPLMALITAILN